MRLRLLLLLASVSLPGWGLSPHPRIWLTSDMMSYLAAKKAANTADWASVAADAATSVTQVIPKLTITTATEANPVQFTVVESLAAMHITTGMEYEIAIAGATGAWAGINNTTAYHGWTMTVTGTNTFTIPVDATTFGSFSGQTLTTFVGHSNSGADFYTGYIDYGYRGSGVYKYAMEMGVVYRLKKAAAESDWTTYRDALKAFYVYLSAVGAAGIQMPMEPTNCYSSRFFLPGFALMHDWLWDDLTPTERTNGGAALVTWGNVGKSIGCYVSTPGQGVGNFWAGHVFGVGLAGYALADEDSGNSATLVAWARGQWNTYFVPEMSVPGGIVSGGSWWESDQYGDGTYLHLMEYALAVETATGEVLMTQPYAQQWAQYMPYLRRPDRWGTEQESVNSEVSSVGVMRQGELMLLSKFTEGTTEGSHLRFMLSAWGTLCCGHSPGTELPENYDSLLWNDPGRTSTSYTSLPTAIMAAGRNMLISRDDWTDGSTWFTFHGGTNAPGSHGARAAGNIEIWRGADRLMGGVWNQASAPVVGLGQSVGANTLFLTDDASFDGISSASGTGYYGGQKYWGAYRPLKYKIDLNYTFGTIDLTEAYNNTSRGVASARTLKYFYRTYARMAGGATVVWDRVRVKDSAYAKHIRWNVMASPSSVDATTYKTTLGSSTLFIKTLLPAALSIVSAANTVGSAATYRLEVTESPSAVTLNVLTVLYPTTASGSLPDTQQITTDANSVGVQIADPTPKVVILPAAVTDNGDYTYTSTFRNVVTFTSTHTGTGDYLVAGLASGTYTLSLGGSTVSTGNVVGADGTFYFTSTSGAFTVQAVCSISPMSLGPWAAGQVISQGFTAPGCGASTWGSSGTWPTGLTFSGGILSGTLTTVGTFTPTATYDIASQPYSITVSLGPSITTTSLPNGATGVPYSQTLAATGDAPITWSLSGALCTGLSLSSGGIISGTPTSGGTCSFTVGATNAGGSAMQALNITITAPPTSHFQGLPMRGVAWK